MKSSYIKFLLSSFIASALLSGGATNATDQRMWRDQVGGPIGSVIVLKSISVDPDIKLGNDSLPWREQVDVAGEKRIFILEPARHRYAKTVDTRLWREQIKTATAENYQRIAKVSVATDKTPN